MIHAGREATSLTDNDRPPYHHPVIIKLYGSVAKAQLPSFDYSPSDASFVISEDDHLWHARHANFGESLPLEIGAKLRSSGFLILEQGARTWYQRALLRSLWQQMLDYKSHAVSLSPDYMERAYWTLFHVDLIRMNLNDYVRALAARIERYEGI